VRWPIAPIVLCLLLLGACGDSTVTESQLSGRYEADTTVLDAGEGPALCLGGIATSLPPRCGGVPVLGWDWSEVSGEQRRGGVTWGEYHVEGTYDGTTFTLLEAGPPQPRPEEPGDLFAAPCPEPEGGWVDTDPSSTKDSDRTAAMGVAEAIDSVDVMARQKKLQLEWHPNSTCRVMGDAARLQQVVWNLLTNAIKFTPEGGSVRVSLATLPGMAELRVSDSGVGIRPEILDTIFNPFQQGERHGTPGLGLGLAIVRQVVEAHEGTVLAESEGLNRGATLIVRLPRLTE